MGIGPHISGMGIGTPYFFIKENKILLFSFSILLFDK
jgi:hypothetical protein